MKTIVCYLRSSIVALTAALVLAPTPALAQSSCIVGFDDPFALGNFYHQARNQFGLWSRWDAANDRVGPASVPGEAGSWFYRQRCGSSNNYVNVEPLSNFGHDDHLHLPFDNPALSPACTCSPSEDWWMEKARVGYGVCGSSTCPDWKNEPRSSTYPHTSADGVLFEFDDSRYFDMYDVTIAEDRSVWAIWNDGVNTWSSGELPPGYHVLGLSNVRWVQFLDWRFWNMGEPVTNPISIFDSYLLTPGGQLNLAVGKPATQSSTAFGGAATRATDGWTNGQWSQNSVTHTDFEAGWWQVDLGKPYRIGRVEIFNRTDCCGDRLSNFDVEATFSGVSWTQRYVPGPVGSSVEVDFNGTTAQYLRVKLRSANYLSLAEVRVWAAPPP
jgi:hypothetical protein